MDQFFKAIPEQANAKDLQKALEGTVAKDSDVAAAGSIQSVSGTTASGIQPAALPSPEVPPEPLPHLPSGLPGRPKAEGDGPENASLSLRRI